MTGIAYLMWPLITTSLLLFSCTSTNFSQYSKDMFEGRKAYEATNYSSARSSFLRASEKERTPASLAWAATSSYSMNDLDAAERLIRQAESVDSNSFSSLRIRGYKALILLKENRKAEGLEALREYVDLYGRLDPLKSIREVERMAQMGNIDLPRLQRLINEQVGRYESDIQQAQSTGTGYYGEKWETQFGAPPIFH